MICWPSSTSHGLGAKAHRSETDRLSLTTTTMARMETMLRTTTTWTPGREQKELAKTVTVVFRLKLPNSVPRTPFPPSPLPHLKTPLTNVDVSLRSVILPSCTNDPLPIAVISSVVNYSAAERDSVAGMTGSKEWGGTFLCWECLGGVRARDDDDGAYLNNLGCCVNRKHGTSGGGGDDDNDDNDNDNNNDRFYYRMDKSFFN